MPDAATQGVRRPAGKWHPSMHVVVLMAMPIVYAAVPGRGGGGARRWRWARPGRRRTDPQHGVPGRRAGERAHHRAGRSRGHDRGRAYGEARPRDDGRAAHPAWHRRERRHPHRREGDGGRGRRLVLPDDGAGTPVPGRAGGPLPPGHGQAARAAGRSGDAGQVWTSTADVRFARAGIQRDAAGGGHRAARVRALRRRPCFPSPRCTFPARRATPRRRNFFDGGQRTRPGAPHN